jgi:hypothetical protein
MTEHYTHFDPLDFAEVPKIQEALLAKKLEATANEQPILKVVKTPQREKRPIPKSAQITVLIKPLQRL